MKNRLKELALMLLLILCLVAFGACGDANNQDTSSDTSSDTNSDTDAGVCVHRFGDWHQSKPVNCLGKGEETRICDFCDEKETREFEAEAGECDFTDWATALDAGCTDVGISARICKLCNNIETKVIDLVVHEDSDWTVTTAPTCLEGGVEVCNCRCAEERALEALGHNIETAEPTPPTMEYGGVTTYWACTRCGIEGGDEAVPSLSQVQNVASLGTYSHTGGDFWAFDPKRLYDGKEDSGTRSPKGGDYSIFVDYTSEYYVTTFKLKCNGAGSLSSGSTELVYNVKNISINFYDMNGKQIQTTGKTDVSNAEYIECVVNQFITRVEIQIFGGGHSGGEFLWELYIMAPPTQIKE
ncbi:MAG: hypothetical protein J6C61_04475 [Clostridia bacterium]|nr:hypothetical protein [Clostridia bacterium]